MVPVKLPRRRTFSPVGRLHRRNHLWLSTIVGCCALEWWAPKHAHSKPPGDASDNSPPARCRTPSANTATDAAPDYASVH